MGSHEPQDVRKHFASSFFRNLLFMATGSLLLTGVLMGWGWWRGGSRFVDQLRSLFALTEPQPEVDVESLVVQQVRGASELTTAIFAMQAVVPTKRDRTLGGYVVGSTTLLYLAYGEVRAGVDLSPLTRADVQIVNKTLRLRLPPPRILDSKIDVNRSRVYDYDRGFLGLGPDVAPDLQEAAQRQTLEEIVAAACHQRVLQEANQRAQLAVSQLLATAGYQQVVVETQPPDAASCPTSANAVPQPVPLPPLSPNPPSSSSPNSLPNSPLPPEDGVSPGAPLPSGVPPAAPGDGGPIGRSDRPKTSRNAEVLTA